MEDQKDAALFQISYNEIKKGSLVVVHKTLLLQVDRVKCTKH